MIKVYIDGQEGTTGLKINERFAQRKDIEILRIPENLRKDNDARAEYINNSDVTFLCLPDSASMEAVSFVKNDKVKIIDASTAHRTNPDWVYGFPELDEKFREGIKSSKRVAVPGCYASGFASLVYPLVKMGILPKDYPVVCTGISGYSGAGKKAIASYEAEDRNVFLDSPRQYALEQSHKHLKEMKAISNLSQTPIFTPYVCDYFSGMQVVVPLFSNLIGGKTAKEIHCIFEEYYKGQKMVNVLPFMGENAIEDNKYIPSNIMAGRNDMQIFVGGNDERILLCSVFDNLGKGASGAAVQCMNIMFGLDETLGLI